ncbi:hypothetical protein SAJA_07205 [Salinisphaera japonica YTM-1]|uniref:Uncharacterized protein n=1 Tax=Salinisphaera japonica YTM-1 TaxID=1209778 RepID=A0A423PTM0_9GAMM|nr:hypothetical protein SAJA_07205 [Salinisphaera japonica YTM-1]
MALYRGIHAHRSRLLPGLSGARPHQRRDRERPAGRPRPRGLCAPGLSMGRCG